MKAIANMDDLKAAVNGAAPVITNTAKGNTIVLYDSADRPIDALTLYGKSSQDGTPTPEAPVPIVSVGDGGKVNVTAAGTQLLAYPFECMYTSKGTMKTSITTNGITYTVNSDQSVTVKGTNNTTNEAVLFLKNNGSAALHNYFIPSGNYYVSASGLQEGMFLNMFYGSGHATYETPGRKWIIDNTTGRNYSLAISVEAGATVDTTIRVMLNRGSTALPWEPYVGQSLSLSTPNGLLGIPVDSGGNYTDENGQSWVCDEIDLARGVYVQRIGKVDNTKWTLSNIASGTTGTRFVTVPNGTQAIQAVMNTPVICTHYEQGKVSFTTEGNFISTGEVATGGRIHIRTTHENMTAEDFIAWAEEAGMKTYYILAAPVETDLSTEEIAAFKELHTYCPTTTIYNDSGAGQAVTYAADTKSYIDNKFAELQNAILSTGGNV